MSINLNIYADIQRVITNPEYAKNKHLIVKEFGKVFIIKYDKIYLNINNINTLGLFRSIIVDEKANLLSFSPIKSYNLLNDDLIKNKNFDDCCLMDFIEGTMINLFWHPYLQDWELSTKSNIGAKNSFNNNNKTFRYMFLQACNEMNLNFDLLDKKYSYSFVLQHPDNRIVVPFTEMKLYLTNIYSFDNNNMINMISIDALDWLNNTKVHLPSIFNKEEMNINSFHDLINHVNTENLNYKIVGYICYNYNTGERIKIRNNNYEIVRRLKGNTPKLQFQYFHLRQLDKVKEFLRYYPEYNAEFSNFRNDLHKWTQKLYNYYIQCFIKKDKSLKEYPYEFKPHLYELHKLYINTLMPEKKYISKSVVINYINNLPPQRLMYSINHQIKLNNTDKTNAFRTLD